MTEPGRPRPRPRPRPKAQVADSVPTSSSSTQASSSSSAPAQTTSSSTRLNVVDNDEMFMRNRSRTLDTWKKLDEMDQSASAPALIESDSETEPSSPRPLKRKKRRPDNAAAASRIQQQEKLQRLLSKELSDGPGGSDDDEIQVIGSKSNARSKRLRRRSRSRSLTPPPAPAQAQVLLARSALELIFRKEPRPRSPIELSDGADSDSTLDPELRQIAQSMKRSHTAPTRQSPDAAAETVTITVMWQPHPLDSTRKPASWVFKQFRDNNFSELFDAIADEARASVRSLIVQYQGKRLFSTVTPDALRIWNEANFTACDEKTLEYIRSHPAASSGTALELDPTPNFPSYSEIPPPSQLDQPTDDEDDEDDTFKLVLRSGAVEKHVTLTVRPTTKCGAIVKAYLKKAGLAEKYPNLFAPSTAIISKGKKKGIAQQKDPQLSVDGDRMSNDTEIRDADLEDGDLVEVVGL